MSKQQIDVGYRKFDSFANFHSLLSEQVVEQQRDRACRILTAYLTPESSQNEAYRPILKTLFQDLTRKSYEPASDDPFTLTRMSAEEMARLDDDQLPRYLWHRYRYQNHPSARILDQYPPYVQIEPTSICNYRCTFCYQADHTFSNKRHGFMGQMSLELFRHIVDQLHGEVEFISLSSRGEPLLCKQIEPMLAYCQDKFLGLKINTNASELTEQAAHAILTSGAGTCVFSVDAVDAENYARLRVNGHLDRVRRNIEQFQNIRAKHYPKSRLITRVSGVFVEASQSLDNMADYWGSLVDQVTFVRYNPWENIYQSPANDISAPCSDLWRRLFIWYDGQVNPCDCDYKSTLAVGRIQDASLLDIWQGAAYRHLRDVHLSATGRSTQEPCRRCCLM